MPVITLGALSGVEGGYQAESKEDSLKKLMLENFFVRSIPNFQPVAPPLTPQTAFLFFDQIMQINRYNI